MNWTSRFAAAMCVAVLMLATGCDTAVAPDEDNAAVSFSVAAKSPRMNIPEDMPGYPFYFNALNPVPIANPLHGYPDWVPVYFYHPVDCVPAGTDLLVGGVAFASLACPSTVSGFLIWPEDYSVPKVDALQASGEVPFWFVRLEEWLEAADDGHVYIEEVQELPSFRTGKATFFTRNVREPGGETVAHGYVTSEPGLTFSVHIVAQFVRDENGVMTEEKIPLFEVDFK